MDSHRPTPWLMGCALPDAVSFRHTNTSVPCGITSTPAPSSARAPGSSWPPDGCQPSGWLYDLREVQPGGFSELAHGDWVDPELIPRQDPLRRSGFWVRTKARDYMTPCSGKADSFQCSTGSAMPRYTRSSARKTHTRRSWRSASSKRAFFSLPHTPCLLLWLKSSICGVCWCTGKRWYWPDVLRASDPKRPARRGPIPRQGESGTCRPRPRTA